MKPRGFLEGLTFKLADDSKRDEALALRRKLYLEEFGHDGLDEFDLTAHHLIAVDDSDRVVAGLRIVDAYHRPFDLENFVDLPKLGPKRNPAEVARFCVAKDYRQVRPGQIVHLGLFKLLYMFAEQRSITDVFTLGIIELRKLYKFAFFSETEIMCRHPIGDRIVQLMHLDLVNVRLRYSTSNHPMARLLFQTTFDNIIL